MSAWDLYSERMSVRGNTRRDTKFRREQRDLWNMISDSLSYFDVLVDGTKRQVAIKDSDNLNEKTMFSMPGEDFKCGTYVYFQDTNWLILEKDANKELYTRVNLLQCNHKLKWIDENHIIHEQWAFVEDGTKYLTGELEDRKFITTRGDSRIAVTLGKNKDSVKLGRNHRFLVDDMDREHKLAYALTKPLMIGKTYEGEGVFSFVLQEVVSTVDDNMELGIADYYKHFPKQPITNPGESTVDGKRVYL